MSRENVGKFFELVKTEEKLARKVVELNEDLHVGKISDEDRLIDEYILPLAKDYGLEFTVDEFLDYSQAHMEELSDDMLNAVTGGKFNPKIVAFGALAATAFSILPTITGSFASASDVNAAVPVDEFSYSYGSESDSEDEDDDDDYDYDLGWDDEEETSFHYKAVDLTASWKDIVEAVAKQVK